MDQRVQSIADYQRAVFDIAERRCCTNCHWPARGPPIGSSGLGWVRLRVDTSLKPVDACASRAGRI